MPTSLQLISSPLEVLVSLCAYEDNFLDWDGCIYVDLRVHIPKTHYNRFPNPLQTGERTPFGLRSLHCGNRATSCRLCNLAEDLGVVLELRCFRETAFLLQQIVKPGRSYSEGNRAIYMK